MTAHGEQLRGHPIYWHEPTQQWRYSDTHEPTATTWQVRDCGCCGQHTTDAGHDPCLGELPGVSNACCGHGNRKDAYIQFTNSMIVRGFDVVEVPNEDGS